MKLLHSLLFILLGVMPIFPAHADAFDQANQKFSTGDYADAATAYEQIITKDGASAAAYYNLGNCYQRMEKLGPAILAYERARLLSPRDPDLAANLTLARKTAAAFEEPALDPRLDAVLRHLSRNEWSWLVAAPALFLGGLALLVGILGGPRKSLRPVVTTSAIMAALCIMAGSAALYLTHDDTTRGIIISDAAAVRLSPFETAESLGTPGPGRSVRMGKRNGDFHYIEIPTTELRGWVHCDDVTAIL